MTSLQKSLRLGGLISDNESSFFLRVLEQRDHGFGIGAHHVGLWNQLHFVTDSYDFAPGLCLDVLFRDILGLVVEKTVGVPGPGNAPHIYLKNAFVLQAVNFFKVLNRKVKWLLDA